MASKTAKSTIVDILRSPEFTGEEAFDHKAFHISSVIKSGKHGQVSLCDSAELEGPLSSVAIKTEIIKSPQNPHARPYREYFILKQLGTLCTRSDFYPNRQWVGFIRLLDWFKAKTDVVRIKEGEFDASPAKTPSKVAAEPQAPQSTLRPTRPTNARFNAPMSAPKSLSSRSRLSENDAEVGNLADSLGDMAPFSPAKRRNLATPAPKRVVPRTPMMMSSAKKQREIKLQEGNLVLERADTTLHHIRQSVSFQLYRDLLFQIMYALYIGQSQFQFMHHDLHLQNVLLKRLKFSDGATLDESLGKFVQGSSTWYSRGPWVVKLSDFGLSRITMVDNGGTVVYDVAQPLSEAFVGDKDVLKVLEEFSRLKITHWLQRADLEACGVKMSVIKASWFSEVDGTIALDDVLSTIQDDKTIERLNELIAERQKAIKTIRLFIRKSALHLDEILHHEFFDALKEKPTSLWLLDRNSSATPALNNNDSPSTLSVAEPTSPTHLRPSINTATNSTLNSPAPATPTIRKGRKSVAASPRFSPLEESASFDETVTSPSTLAPRSSTSPDSPPLPVKKLDFFKDSSDTPALPLQLKTTQEIEVEVDQQPPIPLTVAALAAASLQPAEDDAICEEPSSPARTERRSSRVATKNTSPSSSPRKPLVKPDPVVLARSAAQESQEDIEKKREAKREPTPAPSSAKTKRGRRATILPDAFPSTVGEHHVDSISAKLSTLSIETIQAPQPSIAIRVQAKIHYEPVPSKWLGEPMVLPLMDKEPLNCIEALKEYLSRRAARLEELKPRRSTKLKAYFVRSAEEIAAARVERLAQRRRRRKPIGRRSLGSLRSIKEISSMKEMQQQSVGLASTSSNSKTSSSKPTPTKSSEMDNGAQQGALASAEVADTPEKQQEKAPKPAARVARPRRRSISSPRELVPQQVPVEVPSQEHAKKNQDDRSNGSVADDEGEAATDKPRRAATISTAHATSRSGAKVSSRARTSASPTPSNVATEDIPALSTSSDGQRITTPTKARRISRRASLTPTPLSPLFPSIAVPNAEDTINATPATSSAPRATNSSTTSKARPPTPVKSVPAKSSVPVAPSATSSRLSQASSSTSPSKSSVAVSLQRAKAADTRRSSVR